MNRLENELFSALQRYDAKRAMNGATAYELKRVAELRQQVQTDRDAAKKAGSEFCRANKNRTTFRHALLRTIKGMHA